MHVLTMTAPYLDSVFPHHRPDANRYRRDRSVRRVNRLHFSGKEACPLRQLKRKHGSNKGLHIILHTISNMKKTCRLEVQLSIFDHEKIKALPNLS